MIKYLYIIFIVLSANIFGQESNNHKLKSYIENNSSLAGSFIGVSVLDLTNKKTVLNYNADKNFIPASVLKLFYTLAAIDTKGKDFKFKTEVSYTGNILFDGTLEGDLIISASGDPTLGSSRFYKKGVESIFKRITKSLTENKITCIEGDIIIESAKNSYPIHGSWTTEDIGNYYAGGTWGINFNENQYKIKFKLGKTIGDKTKIISVFPEIPYLKIKNQVTTAKKGTGDNSYIYGLPFSFYREVKGTLPIDNDTYTIKGSMPNPPLVFLRLLANYLDNTDFYFNSFKYTEFNHKSKKHLFDIESPTLGEIAKTCNNWSINLYSESIAKLLCLKTNHPNDYLYEKEIQYFLKKYNIDFTSTQIVDGCGLSSENHVSPKTINLFIEIMVDKLGLSIVLDVLPKAGVEGYAKKINIQNLWIKSGSIQGVLNYSGIFKNINGKYYAFSIMSNNNNMNKDIKKNILKLIKSITSNSYL